AAGALLHVVPEGADEAHGEPLEDPGGDKDVHDAQRLHKGVARLGIYVPKIGKVVLHRRFRSSWHADATARSVQAERRLDIALHGDEARTDVVLELALLHEVGGHAAVEGDDLAVDGAAHRHADREVLAPELAEQGAEAA